MIKLMVISEYGAEPKQPQKRAKGQEESTKRKPKIPNKSHLTTIIMHQISVSGEIEQIPAGQKHTITSHRCSKSIP
jgi:hypothetical protein